MPPRRSAATSPSSCPWFALGFALYAVAYAAAGALASRQQDANSAGQPVTYTLLAAYFLGYIALSADSRRHARARAHDLPADRATGAARAERSRRRAALGARTRRRRSSSRSIYALIRFAGRVYAHGLLHSGPRLSARAAWDATRQRRATQ